MLHRHAVDEETSSSRMIEEPTTVDYKNMPANGGEPDSLVVTNRPQSESHTRSLLKGISWRLVATSTTVVISYFVTGEVYTALRIGFIESILKIFIYYVHERIWAKLRV